MMGLVKRFVGLANLCEVCVLQQACLSNVTLPCFREQMGFVLDVVESGLVVNGNVLT